MTLNKIKFGSELVLLFIGLPVLYRFDFLPGLWKMIPLILLITYCTIILRQSGEFKSMDFQFKKIKRRDWVKLLVFPLLLYLTIFLLFRDNMFADFENPRVLIAVVAYPLFSSLPQEIIYRKFFYFRFSRLIQNKSILILLNAVLFSFAHLYFQNYIALVLTFLGGLAFSYTYLKTKSLLFVSIEHSVYGLALLCSIMNQYFYKEF